MGGCLEGLLAPTSLGRRARGRLPLTVPTQLAHTQTAGGAASGRHASGPVPRDARLSALVFATYLLLAGALFWQAWAGPESHLVGGGADMIQQLWVIASVTHALFHGGSPLFTHLLNYPNGVNLMWDGLPFTLVPAYALGDAVAGPVPAYDFLMTLVLALDAWTGYLACGHWVESRRAAVLGGLLFGFGPAVVAQAIDHPFLAAAFFLPLALLCLDELAVRQSGSAWRWGSLLGVVAAAQFYTSEEVWATMAVVSAAGLLWLGCYRRHLVRDRLRHLVSGLGWGLAVMVPLVAGPLAFQLLGPGAVHGAPLPPSHFSGDLVGFVVPNWVTGLAVPGLKTVAFLADPVTADFGLYVGLPVAALMVGLLLRQRGIPVVAFFLGWTLIVALLVMGPAFTLLPGPGGLPLPDALLGHLPFVGYFLPVRLDVYLDLGVAVLVALFADRALARGAKRTGRLATIVVAASWLPTLAYPSTQIPTPKFFTSGHFPTSGSVLVIPYARDVNSDTAMLWQVESGFRFATPEGYFTRVGSNVPHYHGPAPTAFTNDVWLVQFGGAPPTVTAKVRTEADRYLTQHHVTATVLGPMQHRVAMRRWLTSVFARAPVQKAGVDVWYGLPARSGAPTLSADAAAGPLPEPGPRPQSRPPL